MALLLQFHSFRDVMRLSSHGDLHLLLPLRGLRMDSETADQGPQDYLMARPVLSPGIRPRQATKGSPAVLAVALAVLSRRADVCWGEWETGREGF